MDDPKESNTETEKEITLKSNDNLKEKEVDEDTEDSPGKKTLILPKLTPTGKVSQAKTRVYTQRYRKEWEEMEDFKGWLTSVPHEATRAYCIFCEKNLHAHRLSLLKHMCTLKHNRAGEIYKKKQLREAYERGEIQIIDGGIIDYDGESIQFEEGEIVYESEYESQDEHAIEEVNINEKDDLEEVDYNDSDDSKNRTIKKERKSEDPLTKAMAEVHGEFANENEGPIHLEMIVESENDNNLEHGSFSYVVQEQDQLTEDMENQIITVHEETNKKRKRKHDEHEYCETDHDSTEDVQYRTSKETEEILQSSKMVVLSSSGKPFALTARKIINSNKFIVNPYKHATDTKKISTINDTSKLAKAILIRQPRISTRVYETSKGIPVCGMQIILYKLQDGKWTFIYECASDEDGRYGDFVSNAKVKVTTGRYKLHYDIQKYYAFRKVTSAYPFIEIVFDIKNPGGTYHIPLFVTAHSYSTHRDQEKL